MDKMSMESVDLTQKNIEKIYELFPSVVTEKRGTDGQIKKAVNFELLKQILSNEVVEGDEAYEFTWVGKKEAMAEAGRPIRKTLRPCKEESKSWDNTENLYIEGDNLEVLKLLQESYLGQVKMIYIDPPYNTGGDFIYQDDFKINEKEYVKELNIVDEENQRLIQNSDTNGRFHSDWCSMMYSRLLMARNLLTDDGAIFVSIDDNESMNLVKICDEIFGENNRIALICHKSRASISNDKIISPNHNTILFYAKKIESIHQKRKMVGLDPVLDGFNLEDDDGRGPYRLVPVDGPGGAKKGNPYYEFLGVEGYFRFSKDTLEQKYKEGLIIKKGNGLYQKYYMSLAKSTRKTDTTWWDDGGFTSTATTRLKNLMGGATFDTPKPVELIERMLKLITFDDPNSIILDFFSGSSTAAQAVMNMNQTDNGKRKFIMIQIPEKCNEKSEAFINGYKDICQIGKERIRRSGDQLIEDNSLLAKHIDVGFRVFKLDDSNMKDVYYSANQMTQDLLEQLESNIKEDRTDLDLLYGCLLEWGLPLSLPYSSENVGEVTIHIVNDGDLIACFDSAISEEVVRKIAKRQPLRVVFRDSSFENTPAKINVEEIFKLLAPNTRVKVI